MLVTNQFPNSWLGHFLQDKLSNAGMAKEMCMQRKATLFRIIVYGMLQGIDGKRMATRRTFEGNKNLIDLRKEISAFVIQICIQRGKRVAIHEDDAGMTTLAVLNVDTPIATLDILEADSHNFVVSSDDLLPGSTLRSSELTLIMYGCIGAKRRSSYIITD